VPYLERHERAKEKQGKAREKHRRSTLERSKDDKGLAGSRRETFYSHDSRSFLAC
jgi:hypothetical protein